MKYPTETVDEFRKRLNQRALDEDEQKPATGGDATAWYLGEVARNKGSIHSDFWVGTAADLAERGWFGEYTVKGCWKDQPKPDRSEIGARYALVIGIETEAVEQCVLAGVGFVTACMRETLQIVPVTFQDIWGASVAQLGDAGGLIVKRLLQQEQLAVRIGSRVPDGRILAELALLIEHSDSKPAPTGHRTTAGNELPGDQPEEGGLAASVSADDSPAVAAGHREGHVLKQRSGGEIDRYAAEAHLGHGCVARLTTSSGIPTARRPVPR